MGKNVLNNPDTPGVVGGRWESFYLDPYACNYQVMSYMVVSLPINISENE